MIRRDDKFASLFVAGIMFIFMGLFLTGIYLIVQDVNQDIVDKGGLKGIAISIGKTMKEIKQEIDKEEPKNGENTD